VARLSDVLRRPADGGVGVLQLSYAGRLIEERVGGRRPGCVGSECQDMRPVEREEDCTRCRGRMAIREGARADGGWEEGARREGMTYMGMASSQAKVGGAVPPGQTPHDSFTRQQCPIATTKGPFHGF
jgi:hypothetical protein